MLVAAGYVNLESLWFLLIAVLWTGFFVLEGFDFGVGMTYRFLGRDDEERRALLGPILPTWDGYEVWLIVAGGATFAAFPGWYATLFSGFYVAFFLLLVALIVRGVAVEYRNKNADPAWRRRWDVALPLACGLAAFLFGVAVANFVHGVPFDRRGNVTASLLDLLNGYALLGGFTLLCLFALHGMLFLSMREEGPPRERARAGALRLWPAVVALLAAFVSWTAVDAASRTAKQIVVLALLGAALAAAAAVQPLAARRRAGFAFLASVAAIALLTASLFLWLYPRVLVSGTPGVASPTIFTTASGHYSLVAMTIIALIFVPLAISYQSWAYRVFLRRLRGDDSEPRPPSPLDRLARTPLGRRPASPG